MYSNTINIMKFCQNNSYYRLPLCMSQLQVFNTFTSQSLVFEEKNEPYFFEILLFLMSYIRLLEIILAKKDN